MKNEEDRKVRLNDKIEILTIQNSPPFGFQIFEKVKVLDNLSSLNYSNYIIIRDKVTFENALMHAIMYSIKSLKDSTLNCNNFSVSNSLTQMSTC